MASQLQNVRSIGESRAKEPPGAGVRTARQELERPDRDLVERKHAPLPTTPQQKTSNLPAGAAPSCRAADLPGGKHCGGDGCARGSSGGTMDCGINGGVRPTYAETRRRGAPGPPPRVEMRRPPTSTMSDKVRGVACARLTRACQAYATATKEAPPREPARMCMMAVH